MRLLCRCFLQARGWRAWSAVTRPRTAVPHPLLSVGYQDRRPCLAAPLSHLRMYVAARATASPERKQEREAASSADAAERQDQLAALNAQLPQYCCGCGVKLQREDSHAPGFFQVPRRLLEDVGLEVRPVARRARRGDEDEAAESDDELDDSGRLFDLELQEAEEARRRRAALAGASLELLGETATDQEAPAVRCARCFSLTHSGAVKAPEAEGKLPAFDLSRKVGRKIALQRDRRATVLCVVDISDFDGSLPRAAIRSLFPPDMGEDIPDDFKFRLVLVVNKFDLLPPQATPVRIERWVRERWRQARLPRPNRVFCVSALNGWGVEQMLRIVRAEMGFRADLWVVGAQNAGKSRLITAMQQQAGGSTTSSPTVAAVPGTTLGLVAVSGVPLGAKQRCFDTPGVPHAHQLTTMLATDEVRALLPRRRLKPRTYRVPAGYSILLGALVQLDIVSIPGRTLYISIFASDDVTMHAGKTEAAAERREAHGGARLVPPYTPERAAALPPLKGRLVVVEGTDWRKSTVDIAIAGFGWIGVGCSGEAQFNVWTLEGVQISTRAALIPDYAKDFQRPGFSNMLPVPPK